MNKIKRLESMVDKLKEAFDYNPATGALTWSKTRSGINTNNGYAGTLNPNGYTIIKFEGELIYAHRIVFLIHHGCIPEEIDHINGEKSDNRIENLRASDKYKNRHNARISVRNKSGVKGVSWCKKTNKWLASVTYMGERHVVGRFSDIENASREVMRKREELHGEFARHA